MIRNSHAACAHAATKVDRAQCRKQRAAAIAAGVKLDELSIERAEAQRAADDYQARIEAQFNALTANQRAQAAVRLQGHVTNELDLMRATISLADMGRTRKTTIAKLSRRDFSLSVDGIDQH